MEELMARLVEYGGHIPADEVAHYAPFIVGFPTSDNPAAAEYPRILRPSMMPTPPAFDGPRAPLFERSDPNRLFER